MLEKSATHSGWGVNSADIIKDNVAPQKGEQCPLPGGPPRTLKTGTQTHTSALIYNLRQPQSRNNPNIHWLIIHNVVHLPMAAFRRAGQGPLPVISEQFPPD